MIKRNKTFFEVLPTIKVNPCTAYYVLSWGKWSISFAMRECWINDIILKLTKL